MKSNKKTPSAKRLFDFSAETETLVRSCDYKRSPAPHNWQDGTFLGDGDTGIMAFAPSHLEWIVNKTDLYDGTVNAADFMPHAEVMERVEQMKENLAKILNIKTDDIGITCTTSEKVGFIGYGGSGGYNHFHDFGKLIHIWYGDRI